MIRMVPGRRRWDSRAPCLVVVAPLVVMVARRGAAVVFEVRKGPREEVTGDQAVVLVKVQSDKLTRQQIMGYGPLPTR